MVVSVLLVWNCLLVCSASVPVGKSPQYTKELLPAEVVLKNFELLRKLSFSAKLILITVENLIPSRFILNIRTQISVISSIREENQDVRLDFISSKS